MGNISSRAGTVAVRAGPLAVPLPGITDARPNLPPQQPADHRIQICGEIRLARVRGCGICAHHKKATARKRLKIPAHQLTKPSLNTVSGDRRANRPAYHKSYPGRFPPSLPSGTPPFARRAPLPRLRLWIAICSQGAAVTLCSGDATCQHVDSSVDRERGSRCGDARGARRVANSDLADVWARSLDGL